MTKIKQAIITGGAIRVGKSIASQLASDGYDVIIIYNSSSKQAEETKADIEQNSSQLCHIYQCNLQHKQNIDEFFSKISNEHQNISLLVNNASIFEKADFEETDEDIFDRHMAINFKAPFFLTQKFSEYVKANKIENANVINILDSYITSNSGAYFAYLLSKKALYEFTNMSAKQLGPSIRVNSISIGYLLASEYWDEEQIEERAKELPLKTKSHLQDVNDAVKYLNNSKYLTGNNIFVDSGHHLK